MPETITDPVYLEAKELEDKLFEQRKFIEAQPAGHAHKKRFDVTAQASHSSLVRQERLEKAYGTPDWTAAKLEAIEGNRRARKIFDDNVAQGIGGWDSGAGPRSPF